MVVLRPEEVRFGDTILGSVSRITVDRFGVRSAEEWGDEGAHLVFADVTRVRVKVRISQTFEASDFDTPTLGAMDELRFYGSSGTDAGRELIRMNAVVESVQYQMNGSRSERSITMVCVSEDGVTDPVVVG